MSRVPAWIAPHVAAVLLSAGLVVGGAQYNQSALESAQRSEYVQTVSADTSTTMAVKLAMVLGSYYESSGKHIGTPYVDKVGKGRPLTVCNGITGQGVIAGKWYSPTDCYRLEKGRYLTAEKEAIRVLRYWPAYDPLAQATFIDFIHNKGPAAFASSSMQRLANAGDLEGACRQNPRWNKGTVNGVLTVLPGLTMRGNSNDEICREWRVQAVTSAKATK